jgi:thiamine pyrophosphate-dependent acetolactate synthase large subunit-like protein
VIAPSDAIAAIRDVRDDEIVVTTMTGLGFWPEPGPKDFRLLGLMGAAASIGLGIAIACPDEDVWVIDGDGSLLMQLGVLTAVAGAGACRLTHVVIDNRVYGVSGAQPVPASAQVDWSALALAAGYVEATECSTGEALRHALATASPGPRLIVARCEPVRPAYLPGVFAFDASGEAARLRANLQEGSPATAPLSSTQ